MKRKRNKNYNEKFNKYYDDCVEASITKGQVFLGFVLGEDENVKSKSKCKLFCKSSKTYWETTSIEKHLRREGCSCKVCSRKRTMDSVTIPEKDMLSKVKASCEYYGSEFVNWGEEGFKGIYSFVTQYCPKHGCTWNTTAAKTLIDRSNVGSGCPDCRKENVTKSVDSRDEKVIESILSTGNFLKGTEMWRSDKTTANGTRNYWSYTCPKCSNDEYVEAGLCSGVFTTFIGGLREGKKSCRCSIGYRWTRGQKTYRLLKLIEKDNIALKRWIDKDTVELHCNECHTEWGPSYNNVVFNGNRCPICSKPQCELGLYTERLDWDDNLYLLRFSNDQEIFYKIGRGFDLKARFKEYPKIYNLKLISSVEGIHQDIYDMEQSLIKSMWKCGFHYKPSIKFGGSFRECFSPEILSHPEIISTFNL